MTRAIITALICLVLVSSVSAQETLKNGQPRPHIKFFTCKNPAIAEEMDNMQKEINDFLDDPTIIYHNHAQSPRGTNLTIGLTYFKRDLENMTEDERGAIPPPPKLAYFIKKLLSDPKINFIFT